MPKQSYASLKRAKLEAMAANEKLSDIERDSAKAQLAAMKDKNVKRVKKAKKKVNVPADA